MSEQTQLIINDDYLNLVPRPNPEEFKALQESIIIHGQREPIVCNPKMEILDGHTRFEICTNLGLAPKFRIEKFETETLERGYVIEANLKRRHLTNFQKVELAYGLFLEMKIDSAARTKTNLKNYHGKIKATKKGRITDNLGREIGVGRNTMQMSLSLIEKAPAPLKNQLREGKISITAAYRLLTPSISKVGIPQKKREKMVQCPCCKESFNKNDLIEL